MAMLSTSYSIDLLVIIIYNARNFQKDGSLLPKLSISCTLIYRV